MEESIILFNLFRKILSFCKNKQETDPFNMTLAMAGALSFHEDKETILNKLIDGCKECEKGARGLSELMQKQKNNSVETEDKQPSERVTSVWVNINEICEMTGLPKSKVKSKKWRDENNFPYHQTADNGKLSFHKDEVNKWMFSQ